MVFSMASPTSHLSKKRKISDISDEDTPKKNHKNKTRQERNDEPTPTPYDEDLVFKVYCPADADDPEQEDAFEGETTLVEGFHCKYRVKPRLWEDIKTYKNVKLHEQTFTTNDLIYVNRRDKPPKAPSQNLTDRELLEYDQKNFWVGQIIQARANTTTAVYLLVAWLYWPHELPKKVQKSYHADGELIYSNAMDVIDATTISSPADIVHYKELVDGVDKFQPTPERFWRQTFDAGAFSKDESNPDVLSPLEVYCQCKQPHNPNKTMFHCPNKSCKSWLHEECLVDEIGKRMYDAYNKGKVEKFVKEHEPIETLGQRALQPVKALAHYIEEKIEETLDEGIRAVERETSLSVSNENDNKAKTSPATKIPNRKGRGKKRIWDQTLSVSLNSKDTSKPLIAIIKEKIGRQRSWQIGVDCLVCNTAMD